jgi:hypothetical protein
LFSELNNLKKEHLITGVVALISALISLLLFHPGGMTNDAVVQYAQVKGVLPLSAWHPLAFVRVWSVMDIFFDGPMAMLVLHQGAFWLGLWFLAKNLFRGQIIQVMVILVLGFFPVIHTLMGTVWKDASLLSAGILGLGLILEAQRSKKAWLYIPALLAFGYMAAVRHNGLLAVFPILWLIGSSETITKSITKTTGLTFVVLGLAIAMNHSTSVKKFPHLVNQILIWDLWGMSIEVGETMIPSSAFVDSKLNNLDHYREHFNPHSNNSIIFEEAAGINKDIFVDDNLSAELQGAFVDGVGNNFWIYVNRRMTFFKRFLGFAQWKPYMAHCLESVDPAKIGLDDVTNHQMNDSALLTIYMVGLNYFIHYNGFNAVPYFLLVVMILMIGLYTKSRLLAVLMISGLMYWLPHLVIAPSNDFRYHVWLIFMALLGMLFLLFGENRKGRLNG